MSKPSITFYDIASAPPFRTYAPNPSKSRYALNFKRLHNGLQYETSWVDLPDVTKVRKSLGANPVRKLPDGSDFYTLPVIVDHSTSATVGDSFDIALHLDRQYPSKAGEPVLFPSSTASLHRAFNTFVDKIFTDHVVLAGYTMPLNPETAEVSKAEFCRRAGMASWDQFRVDGEARTAMLRSFEAALDELARLYVRKDEGPFLEGAVPMYADLIVGGWLNMQKESLPEWQELRGWHGGLWGTVHDALGKYAQLD
ncbi:glutathione S-transferase-like protein [Mycena sanguinolenta]|nr:glutathione S-transferase-like protein [Mycena sanguinolenta]